MRLNQLSIEEKFEIFPKSIPIWEGKFLFRPSCICIDPDSDEYQSKIEELAPFKFYKVTNNKYLIHLFKNTNMMDKYSIIGNEVWKIYDTYFIYKKGLGLFISDREKISLSLNPKINEYKSSSYIVQLISPTKRSKSGENVFLVIGPTNHKDRKRISTVISSNIDGYKKLKNSKLFSSESLEKLVGFCTIILVTGNLLSEILEFYNQFGSSPKINISKLKVISYGDIIEKESIRLKDVTQ